MVKGKTGARHMAGAFKAALGNAAPKGGPTISIVVPAYNDEAFVGRAVKSCLAQTYGAIEVVCVDDGSTDGTLAALEQLAADDEKGRVRTVALERNSGPHNARRAGLAQATGDLVTFLDADDELTRDACARIAGEYAAAPADILHFGARVRRDGRATAQQALDVSTWMEPVPGCLFGRDILVKSFEELRYTFTVCSKAYRTDLAREAFDALGPRESDFGEDALEYFAIAFFAKTYRGLPERRLYVYHLGDGLSARRDMTAADFARTLRGVRSVDGMRAFLESQGAFDEYAGIYEAHRANQLGVLLRSWANDVRERDREEVLRQIIGIWPREKVLDGLCDLGTSAVDALRRCTGEDIALSDEQRYRCGLADGAASAREEFESSASYRVGRAATALPRALRTYLKK